MATWFHRFLHPHCPHCKEEREDAKICLSCETLRQEVERLIYENQTLLNRVLQTNTVPEEPKIAPPMMTKPKGMPWAVRRQMLEAEDRRKAQLLRDAPKPQDVEELEKELDVATAEREAHDKSKSGASA